MTNITRTRGGLERKMLVDEHGRLVTINFVFTGRLKSEYNANGSIAYQGWNSYASAATSDTDWMVTKYAYDANGYNTDAQTLQGSWDGRASILWDI